jgi:uncharacterized ferritin-like protein (DUF455 family)
MLLRSLMRPRGRAMSTLVDRGLQVLRTRDLTEKTRLAEAMAVDWAAGGLELGALARASDCPDYPGRPERVLLFCCGDDSPSCQPALQAFVPSAKNLGVPVNVHILHQLAHVEITAVDMVSALGQTLFTTASSTRTRWCVRRPTCPAPFTTTSWAL